MVDPPKVHKLGPKPLLLDLLIILLRGLVSLLRGVLAHVFEKALRVFLRRRGHPGDEGHSVFLMMLPLKTRIYSYLFTFMCRDQMTITFLRF